jgi:HD superfamily phosphodiesterase
LESSLQIIINRAEDTWLSPLYSNAESLFSDEFLPSHDHTHHQRVWNLCKSLLLEISRINSSLDQSLVEGVLIAAFFHDLGMVYSTREDHGKLGRELCDSWFREKGFALPHRFEEIQEAIELHDNKEKGSYSIINRSDPPQILSLLSMADDLEAFGNIGIYRYAEIYLLRHISLNELGDRILANAESRFQNLQESCKMFQSIITLHQKEYAILRDFYQSYKLQLQKEAIPEKVFVGHLGVINYIRTLGMEQHISPENFSGSVENEDTIVSTYFRTLKNELEQARN